MSEEQASETLEEPTQPQSPELPPEQEDAAVPAAAPVDVAAAPPPSFFTRKRLLLLLAVLIVLAGGAGGLLYLSLNHASSPASAVTENRHGLPDDIPLPDNSTLVKMAHSNGAQEWLFTVSLAPDAVSNFYVAQLPGNGWTLSPAGASTNRSVLHAVKGSSMLTIAVSAQAGGTLFQILLS